MLLVLSSRPITPQRITDDLDRLLEVLPQAVQQALGGIRGCTHLTEMLGQFSTVAFQTFAGNRRDNDSGDTQPAQLDHCHALALGSEAVRKYYPRWYQPARSGS